MQNRYCRCDKDHPHKYPIAEPKRQIKSKGRRPYLSLKAPSTGAAKNTQAAYTEVSSVTAIACSSGLLI